MSDERKVKKTTHDSVCFVAKSKTIILTGAAAFTAEGVEDGSPTCTPLDWVSVTGGVFDRFSMPTATKCFESGVNANSVNRMAVASHESRTFPSAS
jgi:hypothetical protein